MTVPADDFRQVLSRFASGVTVVSARDEAKNPIGVTVSAFSSLSLDPPLVLICLDNATSNLQDYTGGRAFAVNILSSEQDDVSNAFAFPGPRPPFEQVTYSEGELDLPLIDGALASLQCTTHAVHPGGDHVIVVGLVKYAKWELNVNPLVYAGGLYQSLMEIDTEG